MNTTTFVDPTTSIPARELIQRQRREVSSGRRFAFGRNWQRFLAVVDEARIRQAEQSLRELLSTADLMGRDFLDIGSGSGLFSLAAIRLGARRVYSFDFDFDCVRCAETLKQRYASNAANWTIETGDVLDANYLASLGRFGVVYSWGVLHQTGDMWRALANAANAVSPQGQLAISLYNHQPWLTPFWRTVKRMYNRSPRWLGGPLVASYFIAKCIRHGMIGGATTNPRGMSLYYDAVDWIGGYPFQTAKREQVVEWFGEREFSLLKLISVGRGSGCNQFVFQRRW